MRYEMERSVTDKRADRETEHHVDNVLVCVRVTEPNNEETKQRDEGDYKHRRRTIAVHYKLTSHSLLKHSDSQSQPKY